MQVSCGNSSNLTMEINLWKSKLSRESRDHYFLFQASEGRCFSCRVMSLTKVPNQVKWLVGSRAVVVRVVRCLLINTGRQCWQVAFFWVHFCVVHSNTEKKTQNNLCQSLSSSFAWEPVFQHGLMICSYLFRYRCTCKRDKRSFINPSVIHFIHDYILRSKNSYFSNKFLTAITVHRWDSRVHLQLQLWMGRSKLWTECRWMLEQSLSKWRKLYWCY